MALAKERERPLGKSLWRRLSDEKVRRFQLILGPRRVGKTTVMYQTVRHLIREGYPVERLWWLRLDHPVLMRQELGQLVRLLHEQSRATEKAPIVLFLDELTYAKDWDLWLKTFYDERWPVRIVGTSSATSVMRNRMQESGVGRWEEQYLGPYTFNEYLHLVGKEITLPPGDTLGEVLAGALADPPRLPHLEHERRRYLFTGGFPELLLAVEKLDGGEENVLLESQRTLRSDAIERAIYKDIPQAYGVDNPMLLERLLYILAEQIGGVLSPTNISSDLDGVSTPTFEKYLSYLERAFMVFTLTNYSGSERSKQKRGRKLYFVDGAARNAALHRGLLPMSDPAEMGVLLENLVAGHLDAVCRQGGGRLHFWRDGNDEVDFVFEDRGRLLAFEATASRRHHRGGLTRFAERFAGRCEGGYVVGPSQPVVSDRRPAAGAGALPLDLVVLMAGDLAERLLLRRVGVGHGYGG